MLTEQELLASLKKRDGYLPIFNDPVYFVRTAIKFPRLKKKLINFLLGNPAKFSNWFRDDAILYLFSVVWPNHIREFFLIIFQNLDIFNSLIAADSADSKLKKLVHLALTAHSSDKTIYDLLDDNPTGETCSAVRIEKVTERVKAYGKSATKSEAEVRKNSRLLFQAKKSANSHLKCLPKELMLEIAKFTANPAMHTEEVAERIARRNFRKP